MSEMKGAAPLRIVQWATGTVGAFAMSAVMDHPDMELVGVRVYSDAKAGKDAGELCGRPPIGVAATQDIEAIVALRPDCVIYMPESTNADDLSRLLESGANVVTTRAEFFNPAMMDATLRERIEAACRKGNTSIHATGSSPGFITEALPIVVASLARRLDFLAIEEYANCLEGCSEEMLVGLMGFGDTPQAFAERQTPDHAVFEHSLGLVAAAIGMPIERFEYTVEGAVCREDTLLRTVTIPAGSIGAQRVSITGIHDGKPLMRFRSNWFVTMDIEPAWDLRGDGWRFTMEGDTPVSMLIDLPMPIEADMRASGRYTAHRPVNVIPYIVAAEPGIVPTTKLPEVIAQLGRAKSA